MQHVMPTFHQFDHAPREAWLPAWLSSAVLNVGLVALLVIAANSNSRGPAEIPGSGLSITLDPTIDRSEAGGQTEHRSSATLPPIVLAALESEVPDKVTSNPRSAETANANSVQDDSTESRQQGADTRAQTPRGNYGSGQGKASVQVFGVRGIGTKFVYVFDRSTSMEGAPLAAAKQQLIASLDSLDAIHQFQIVFFNDRLRISDITGGGRRIAFATDRNKNLAEKFVGGITADGGTDRLQALRAAIAMQPDIIFFLTDADDPMPPSELADIERLNRRASAAICTIEFGRGPQKTAANFLSELARASSGQYGYVDTTRLQDHASDAKRR